jgi:ParB/RepB/Spo0J family partition protein
MVMLWPVNRIRRFSGQPRKTFPKEAINSLADAILELGEIINPLIVTPPKDEFVELIDGEMRWRAAIAAGIEMVPVTFNKNVTDVKTRHVRSCIANYNRNDMTPLDVAAAIQQLISDGYNQTAVAKLLGKSPGWVSNMLKLIKLGPEIRKALTNAEISLTIATLLGRYSATEQSRVLQEVKVILGGETKIDPTKAPLLVQKAAEKAGVKATPRTPTSNFQHSSSAQLLASRLARHLKGMTEDLRDFNKLEQKELKTVGSGTLEDLESVLKQIYNDLAKAKHKIETYL